MDKYISWDETWQVLEDREREIIDETVAFDRLVKIFKQAHGTYLLKNGKIIFEGDYDLLDYRYSTSVIGSEEQKWRVEQSKKLLDRVNEERDVLDFYLDRINSTFEPYKPIFLELLYERYFQAMKTEDIQKKYRINKKRYYYVMETSEYWFKEATLILKPFPAIVEHIEYLEEQEMDARKKLVNSFFEKVFGPDFSDD